MERIFSICCVFFRYVWSFVFYTKQRYLHRIQGRLLHQGLLWYHLLALPIAQPNSFSQLVLQELSEWSIEFGSIIFWEGTYTFSKFSCKWSDKSNSERRKRGNECSKDNHTEYLPRNNQESWSHTHMMIPASGKILLLTFEKKHSFY